MLQPATDKLQIMISLDKILIAIAIIAQTTDIEAELEKIQACQTRSVLANNLQCKNISNSVEKLVLAGQNLQNTDLSNLDLTNADLNGVDLSKANLEAAILVDSNLQNANLDLANIDRANFAGANLIRISLRSHTKENYIRTLKVNFHRANLEGADFRRGLISDTNFSNANLTKVKFGGELWKNDFSHANLQQAAIEGSVTSTFTNANLSDADLSSAYIYWSSFERANFARANLNGTQFMTANLNGVSFIGADLSSAQFALHYGSDEPGTTLIEADFTNANLEGATFGSYTDFKNASLRGANLRQAIFIGAKNLTPTQIKSACNWEQGIYKFALDRNSFTPEVTEADRFANQKYIQTLREDSASTPLNPVNCDRWK